MSLTAKDVAEITRLLEESSFDELELEIDGMKLKLRRGAAVAVRDAAARSDAATRAVAATPAPSTQERDRNDDRAADPGLHDVVSPLLGTFYRAPKPGAPPFVETGASVDEDTIIGIIEVMKLMNTVRAGVRGTVEQILAQDGTLVEYGDTLLRVRRA